MEYSVRDLFKILLKKWYIIIITMAVFSLIAIPISRISNKNVAKQYEKNTNISEEEKIKEIKDIGKSVFLYEYKCTAKDFSKYVEEINDKLTFINNCLEAVDSDDYLEKEKISILDNVIESYSTYKEDSSRLLTDKEVINITEKTIGIPGEFYNFFEITELNNAQIRIMIKDLNENDAKLLLSYYFNAIKKVGIEYYEFEVDFREIESSYSPDVLYDEQRINLVELSKVVMKEPTRPPHIVRVVGMAMVMSFAFSCFSILLFTFVNNSKRKE